MPRRRKHTSGTTIHIAPTATLTWPYGAAGRIRIDARLLVAGLIPAGFPIEVSVKPAALRQLLCTNRYWNWVRELFDRFRFDSFGNPLDRPASRDEVANLLDMLTPAEQAILMREMDTYDPACLTPVQALLPELLQEWARHICLALFDDELSWSHKPNQILNAEFYEMDYRLKLRCADRRALQKALLAADAPTRLDMMVDLGIQVWSLLLNPPISSALHRLPRGASSTPEALKKQRTMSVLRATVHAAEHLVHRAKTDSALRVQVERLLKSEGQPPLRQSAHAASLYLAERAMEPAIERHHLPRPTECRLSELLDAGRRKHANALCQQWPGLLDLMIDRLLQPTKGAVARELHLVE